EWVLRGLSEELFASLDLHPHRQAVRGRDRAGVSALGARALHRDLRAGGGSATRWHAGVLLLPHAGRAARQRADDSAAHGARAGPGAVAADPALMRNILLVEADAILARVIARALEKRHAVTVQTSPERALRAIYDGLEVD